MKRFTYLLLLIVLNAFSLQSSAQTGCAGNLATTSAGYYGGFEAGSSNLAGTERGSDLYNKLPRDGSYQIVKSVDDLGGGGYLDIHPRTGNYFLASHTSNDESDRVWYLKINVVPGETYNFCTYVTLLKNLGNGANYILGLYANGTSIGTGRVSFDWTQICGSYTVPAGVTTLELSIRDPKKGLFFVAIDDICVTKTPPAKLTLGNLVWNDVNGNGLKEADEAGVGGVPVKLYTDNNGDNVADNNTAISSTTTAADGSYKFKDLPAGKYIVGVIIPSGYTVPPTKFGNPDNDVDNDNNGYNVVNSQSEVRSNFITLTAGGEPTNDGDDSNGNLTLDIAICGRSTIGDFVFNDLNGNGIQDQNEPGIPNVKVTLTYPDGTTTSKNTDANGKYRFVNLGPGTHKVTFATPSGFNPSPANQGNNDAIDSDPVNGVVTVNVLAAVEDLTIDAGFTKPVVAKLRLGNVVWNDRDGDGKRDPNEPAIPGAPISLYTDNDGDNKPDGAAIKTTMSDDKGFYLFTDLPEGRYIASMPILPGFQQSPNTTSGGIVGNQNGGCCSFNPDADEDNDNNLVRLVGLNKAGQGVVFTNAITLTANQEPTDDGDDANGNLTFDLAECGNGGIGDFVWNDLNGNGIQDAGEPGIDGVTVTITFPDGRTATDVTHVYQDVVHHNAPPYNGFYDFINLGPGTYTITFSTPAGFYPSPALQGNDRSKDSNPINGGPVTVTLDADGSDFTIDAGFTTKMPPMPTCPNLSLGNMVFNDANGNGVRDAGEQGIKGLTVNLYAVNGNTVSTTATSTVITAADGTYYFTNLAEGSYVVGVSTTGSTYTIGANGNANPNDDKDDDNNGVTLTASGEIRSNPITLNSGKEPIYDGSDANGNSTLDFGLKAKGTTPTPCAEHCDCHNDCNHTGCGHPNCGHNSCKNDCSHNNCNHPNCAHNSCKNDCNHTNCDHPNCAHNSCKNDCKHTNCGHPNCSHNSCKNDCRHTGCGHKNCGKNGTTNYGDRLATENVSVTEAVINPELANTSVSIFPNPAKDYIVLKVMAVKSGTGVARITDLSGKLVATKNVTIANGMNVVRFDKLDGLEAGTYYVQLTFNYHTYNQQLIVVK